MSHDFELGANAMVGERERIPKVAARAMEWIQRLFRRSDQEQVGLHAEKLSEESARIAHQLHDIRFQRFLRTSMSLKEAVEEMPANLPCKFLLSPALHHRAIDERHRALPVVRPAKRPSASLERAISGLGRKLTFGRADQFRVLVTGKPRILMPSLQKQIYLIVREAVINAFHHSAATLIEVRIEYLRRRVWVLVRDNGCGFDADMVRPAGDSHLGFRGMCDRAGSAGAQLRIWSKAGAGTDIEISAPTDIAAVQSV